jgi:hypothetical protein
LIAPSALSSCVLNLAGVSGMPILDCPTRKL